MKILNFSRRKFLKAMSIGITTLTANGCAGINQLTGGKESGGQPNIIFILADDMGWAELGCYGNKFNETPNLDKLANQGMRFTEAYAAAPVCSPYRAALMTGQYPARLGITDYLRPNDSKHLSTDYLT
ncbi:MAG: sulfatase-like hydrolase/transferase, partial [Planctomycetota bacterium]